MKHVFQQFNLILVVLLLALNAPLTTHASDDGFEWKGVVSSFTPIGGTGTWIVGGMTFHANSDTRFEMEHGNPATIGACVEVKYMPVGGSNIAHVIETNEPHECPTANPGGGDDGHGDGDDGHGDGDDGHGGGDDGHGDGDDGHGDGDDHEDDGDGKQRYGTIDSMPAAPHYGDWIIGGITYRVDTNSRLESKHGTFATGKCVEIKYSTVGGTNIAHEIEIEHSYKCTASSGDDGAGTSSPYQHSYGIVDSFPTKLIGTWTISGTTYTATQQTRFEQEHGVLMTGGCVDIKYLDTTLREISTTEAYHCDRSGDTTHDPQPQSKIYGIITTIPTDFIGTWVISGENFISTNATKLEQERGPFVTGSCAEVKYYQSNGTSMATKIETTAPYKCSNGTRTNTVYGTITSFPPDFYGTWIIQTSTTTPTMIEAGITTRFEHEQGAFATGDCVQASYYTRDGISYATKIEKEQATYCRNAQDDTPPSTKPGRQTIYATINQYPDPYIDKWIIGGVVYTATERTIFKMKHGPFTTDVCVKVQYTTSDGVNILHKLETQKAKKCQNDQGKRTFRSYGIVETLPISHTTGTWRVGGMDYQAISTTLVREQHGFVGVGAYVEVTYRLDDQNNRIALRITTHVGPGCGAKYASGTYESYDDDEETWHIGGSIYHNDPAMKVEDIDETSDDTSIQAATSQAEPQPGQALLVNYYEDADGTRYVTSITNANVVYVPLVQR